jgi:hypothetical protein
VQEQRLEQKLKIITLLYFRGDYMILTIKNIKTYIM